MSALLRTSLLLMVFGLTFDFRGSGEDGPSLIQFVFFGVAELGALGVIISGLVLSGGRIVTGSHFGSRVLVWTLAFCAWAPVALLVSSDTAHDAFISAILPYLLYGQCLLATLIALQGGVSEQSLIRMLIVVSVISCAWRLVYAFAFGGVEFASVRWQILSPALPFVLGASVAALNCGIHRRIAVIGVTYFLAIVALSVTRSYLVGLAAVLAATVISTPGRGRGLLTPRALVQALLVAVTLSVSVAVLYLVLPAEVSDRWVNRLSSEKSDAGEEITLLYRLAQFKGQYDELTQDGLTLLAGRGFGARFTFDDALLSGLSFVAPDETIDSTYGSDSTWSYPIYTHGIVLGPAFLGAFLFVVLGTLGTARALPAGGPAAFPYFFSCFSLMAFLGVSLTGNIFSGRLGGVLLGVAVAIAVRQRGRMRVGGLRPAASGEAGAPAIGTGTVSP